MLMQASTTTFAAGYTVDTDLGAVPPRRVLGQQIEVIEPLHRGT